MIFHDSQVDDLERATLGGVLLGVEAALPRLLNTGLEPRHFASEAHRHVYRAAISLHQRGSLVDAFLVYEELRRVGKLDWVGGKTYLEELAAAAVTASFAFEHHAHLLRRHARERDLREKIENIHKVATNGGLDLARVRRDLEEALELTAPDDAALRFPGLTLAEVLDQPLPPERHLARDVAEIGTLGAIVGVPETFKSRVALQFALRVAGGGGQLLGLADVLKTGPVAYWWGDDSERNERARIKTYAERHAYDAGLPIRFHLNERLRLPDDIPALRAEIEHEKQILAVLDSLYNFIPDLDPREPDVMRVYTRLKAEVCDPTDCTILIADHAAWPSETNRGQRRAYGSVFKHAAIRWWIHAEPAEGKTVWLQSGGNNVRGFKRTLFAFDEESLELRSVDVKRLDVQRLVDEVVAWIAEHPGKATKEVVAGVGHNQKAVTNALKAGRAAGRADFVKGRSSGVPRRAPNGKYWYIVGHKDLRSSDGPRTSTDDLFGRGSSLCCSSSSSVPRRGDERTDEQADREAEG